MSNQEEPQSLACTPLETSTDYEMDEVFAEEEPQMQPVAMDICDVAAMEEQQKKKEEFTLVIKKNRKRYHPCFEGERRTRVYCCHKKERTLRVSRSFKEERKRIYHFCKKTEKGR